MAKKKKSKRMTKQQKADYYHICDVEQRLTDAEAMPQGKELTPKQVKEYLYRNMSQIIELGRAGWNPFDTVSIIEDGEPEEGWDEFH